MFRNPSPRTLLVGLTLLQTLSACSGEHAESLDELAERAQGSIDGGGAPGEGESNTGSDTNADSDAGSSSGGDGGSANTSGDTIDGGDGSSSSGGSTGGGAGSGSTGGTTGSATAGGTTGSASTGGQPPVLARQLYIRPNGNNSSMGTMEDPLQTLTYAASIAKAGETIWLLDGTYDSTTDAALGTGTAAPCGPGAGVVIPEGVIVRAVNPQAAVLSVSGSHGLCVSGGEIRDLDIRRPSQGGDVISATAGSTLIVGVRVTNAGGGGSGNEAAFLASGTAQLKIQPGSLSNLVGDESYTYARASGQSVIEVAGGAIDGADATGISGNAIFVALDTAKIVLDGVTIANSNKPRLIATAGSPQVELKNGTKLTCTSTNNQGVYLGGGSPTLRVDGATISGCSFAAGNVIYDVSNPTIDLKNAVFENNGNAITLGGATSPIAANVKVVGSTFRNNTQNGLYTNVPGSYAFENSIITGNAQRGLAFWNVANDYDVKVRSTSITNNGGAGLFITGKTGSSLDLGTRVEPGMNTLQGNNTGNASGDANVRMSLTTGDVVPAIGNTWNASVQGATATGAYEIAGAGQKLEVTSGAGANYNVANATLRLAENP